MGANIYLVRHGETAWTLSGQHTSFTDVPLTANGIAQAKQLGLRIKPIAFSHIFCSPYERAQKTCEEADLLTRAQIDLDLQEWNYGDYEGLKTSEIRERNNKWSLFHDGTPNGEKPKDVQQRADRFLQTISSLEGDIAVFSSGHFLRVLAARWVQSTALFGQHLLLSTGSISILGFERETPVVKLWNETSHL